MVEQSPQPSVSDRTRTDENRAGHPDDGSQMIQSRQPSGRPARLQAQVANPLYFPLWSLGFTLLSVLILAAGAVLALVSMRGGSFLPQAEPVIQIVAADPARISEAIQDDADAADNEAAISSVEVVVAEQAPADLAMEGPILPTVAFIPTPVSISVGANVEVAGVGNQELNIRNVPSLTGSKILFRSPEGSLFDIIGGPQEADGFSWWKVRDAQFQLEGWAVANYLQVTS